MHRFSIRILTGLLLVKLLSISVLAQESVNVRLSSAAFGESADVKTNGESKPEYVRIRRNDRKLAAALETSVIKFGNSQLYPKTTVELLGAIHLGEAQYYDRLNSMFSKYDVLLYEAVMPKEAVRRGFRPGVGGGRRSLTDEDQWTEAKIGLQAISVLQLGAKDALGLEFQLAGVDYTSGNFVHADMTQEEFEASMAKRGESFSQMLAREMGKAAFQQQQANPFAQSLDLALSLLTSDRKYRVRRIAAVELTKANDGDAFAGADGTSTIITERNTKALQVLKAQLKKGRRRIGVFYGAGHFPDMEKRVLDEFGYERLSEEWVTAWELRAPVDE
ncbi:MAG: hypothetical protein GY758_16530 [Fuerstiella sp.]|nr:hypothetical protein [Fuerstiella sp.]MCP4510755.1 hypothetical protein [Fuerstiella sp.]